MLHLKNTLHRFVHTKPHLAAAALLLAYLVLFQTRFLFSGDVWAEGYAEYLVSALTLGAKGYFALGWANYFNLIPKTLCDLYVWLHLPLGYIDYYYRFTVVAYTVASAAFIAHPFNRRVIRNDHLRILLALVSVEALYHVSSFSFINVWYIGFIPVILISLNETNLQRRHQVAYTIWATAAVLTKPSIPLLPLVLYRAWRSKEYVSGVIISAAITLQTLLMFLTLKTTALESVRLTTKAVIMIFGSGLMMLKTLHIYPWGFWVVIVATLVLAIICWYVAKTRGLVIFITIGLPLALSIYTYFFVPDLPTPALFHQFRDIYTDDFKLQRATLISFLMLLLIYLAADHLLSKWHHDDRRFRYALPVFIPLALLAVIQYRPIDLQPTIFRADISQFRASLNAGDSVCVPIAPNPGWKNYLHVPPGDWFFQLNGGCMMFNYGKTATSKTLEQKLGQGQEFLIPGDPAKQLKSVLIPVHNPTPGQTKHLELHDAATGKVFPAIIRPKTNREELSYIAFNLYNDGVQSNYRLVLSEPADPTSQVEVGAFTDGSPAYYALFMGYPNLAEKKH